MNPSPERIQAAMPAMREFVARSQPVTAEYWREHGRPGDIERFVEWHWPGGAAQFITDQEERRG